MVWADTGRGVHSGSNDKRKRRGKKILVWGDTGRGLHSGSSDKRRRRREII